MEFTSWALATLSLTAIISTTPAGANPALIVPGHSMGRTALGPHGDSYLKRLPKPTVTDAGMSQLRLVWVSQSKGEKQQTLFIHTVSNGALDVQPIHGVTIDEIRVTSPYFHTRNGIHAGSTLATIRTQFPHLYTSSTLAAVQKQFPHLLYAHERGVYESKGIAFEFAAPVTPKSRCKAITVFENDSPGTFIPTMSNNVQYLLRER